MKNVKLRLNYFLSLGLKLALKDAIESADGFVGTIDIDDVNEFNAPYKNDELIFIKSFAPRKNTGAQPVGDNVPVVVEYYYSHKQHGKKQVLSHAVDWEQQATYKSWKPDLDDLIKMQIEHDARIADKKLCIKTKYVKCEFSKLSEAFAEHEISPFYMFIGEQTSKALGVHQYLQLKSNYEVVNYHDLDNLYRKVETEITPMQAAKEEFKLFLSLVICDEEVKNVMSSANGWDKELLEMCCTIVNAYNGKTNE